MAEYNASAWQSNSRLAAMPWYDIYDHKQLIKTTFNNNIDLQNPTFLDHKSLSIMYSKSQSLAIANGNVSKILAAKFKGPPNPLNFHPTFIILRWDWRVLCLRLVQGIVLEVNYSQVKSFQEAVGFGEDVNGKSTIKVPQKIQMSSEKGPFQKDISSSNYGFSGEYLSFWGSMILAIGRFLCLVPAARISGARNPSWADVISLANSLVWSSLEAQMEQRP